MSLGGRGPQRRLSASARWMPSALATREKGVPLVNIAQVFQKSGMMLTCRNKRCQSGRRQKEIGARQDFDRCASPHPIGPRRRDFPPNLAPSFLRCSFRWQSRRALSWVTSRRYCVSVCHGARKRPPFAQRGQVQAQLSRIYFFVSFDVLPMAEPFWRSSPAAKPPLMPP